jgi:hypothetical protein
MSSEQRSTLDGLLVIGLSSRNCAIAFAPNATNVHILKLDLWILKKKNVGIFLLKRQYGSKHRDRLVYKKLFQELSSKETKPIIIKMSKEKFKIFKSKRFFAEKKE